MAKRISVPSACPAVAILQELKRVVLFAAVLFFAAAPASAQRAAAPTPEQLIVGEWCPEGARNCFPRLVFDFGGRLTVYDGRGAVRNRDGSISPGRALPMQYRFLDAGRLELSGPLPRNMAGTYPVVLLSSSSLTLRDHSILLRYERAPGRMAIRSSFLYRDGVLEGAGGAVYRQSGQLASGAAASSDSVRSGDYRFDLIGCRRADLKVACEIDVQSLGPGDRQLMVVSDGQGGSPATYRVIGISHARDDQSRDYRVARVWIGNTVSGASGQTQFPLLQGTKPTVVVEFNNVAPSTRSFSQIDLRTVDLANRRVPMPILFNNIAIAGSAPGRVMIAAASANSAPGVPANLAASGQEFSTRVAAVDVSPLPNVDEELFLLNTVQWLYAWWAEGSGTGYRAAWLSKAKPASEFRSAIREHGLGRDIALVYDDLQRLVPRVEAYVAAAGKIDGAANAQMADLARGQLQKAVIGGLIDGLGGSSCDVDAADASVADVVNCQKEMKESDRRDSAMRREIEDKSGKIAHQREAALAVEEKKVDSEFSRAVADLQAATQRMTRARGWRASEVAFNITARPVIPHDISERPRDPFLLFVHAVDQAKGDSAADMLARANECIRAARLVPNRPTYAVIRSGFIEQALEISLRVVEAERVQHPVRRPASADAVAGVCRAYAELDPRTLNADRRSKYLDACHQNLD